MNMIIRPVLPDFSALQADNWLMIANYSILIIITVLASLGVSTFAANKWNGNKGKTALGFIAVTLIFTVLLICFFGCTAITVRGIIFCLILLVSSYSDIRTRECSDWLHVMILIAAFIGCDFANLPNMFVSAMFVGGIMLMTLLISNCDIGGADIKCAVACSFLLGLERGIIALVGSMLTALLFNAFKDKEKRRGGFPLIPYLTAGYLAVYLI